MRVAARYPAWMPGAVETKPAQRAKMCKKEGTSALLRTKAVDCFGNVYQHYKQAFRREGNGGEATGILVDLM